MFVPVVFDITYQQESNNRAWQKTARNVLALQLVVRLGF